ncbi:expressed unknown protein [Seminavis robusta]|uniref:Uncharacterized protein n=1 Tax=Seminavis robusta TaxID=568900 RepID=A0A9N8HJW1_9STRA|nr:expressed unknown protein [Seminavis robusta]|eukprot:Sro576_g169490.1 n/a (880) ;mRNA; f:15398-18110
MQLWRGWAAGDQKSQADPSAVTIEPERREEHEKVEEPRPDQVEASNDITMAPKPAIYESSKGGDSEHNLMAASREAANYTKEYPAEYDEASVSDAEHSFVSNSDVSTTDGEHEDESYRKERRSRRRRSRKKKSRSKERRSRSRSVDRGHHEKEEDRPEKPEAESEEFVQDSGLDDSSVPSQHRSSIFHQDVEHAPPVVLPSGKNSDQPVVKLLNFQTLHRAEQDRLPEYSEELKKIVTQWTDCKITLQRLLDEVEHANHLFQVSEASFHQYSHVMFTIHKDIFLDDQGNRVTSSARQQLLLKQRGSGNSDIIPGRDESTLLSSEGYLEPLYNSFSVLTDTMMKTVLERESENGKQAAAIEFQEFSEELITQAEAMRALGDSVVKEMEGSEMDIQNSFRVLEQLAAKVKSAKPSSANVLDDDIKLKKPDKTFPKDMGYGGNNAGVGDWWLWETLYRAAVKHQQITWSANYDRVQGLEESLEYFQDKHEKKLEKAVLAVMPEQREMFLVGAKAFESALKKTDAFAEEIKGNTTLDHENIADEFEQGVQKRSSSLMQEKTHHKSSILNRSRSKYNSAIQQAETLSPATATDVSSKPLPAFGSPMLSKLVLKAQVLERWEKSGWMTTIAIFTSDRYLHLFDCEDLDTKTLPQTAFTSMFPTTATTRANVHHQGKGRKRASRATEHKIPKPSMTFNLVTCTLKTYGYARRSFEIKQVADPTAKSKDLPHTTLRFKDNPEAAQWYGLLQNLPESAPEPSPTPQATHEQLELDLQQVEAEAARANALYDEADELAGSNDEGGPASSEEDSGKRELEDISEGDETQVADNKKNEGEGAGEGDMFEDASEYLEGSGSVEGVVADGFKKEAVEVETVDEKSDDSFHSWN